MNVVGYGKFGKICPPVNHRLFLVGSDRAPDTFCVDQPFDVWNDTEYANRWFAASNERSFMPTTRRPSDRNVTDGNHWSFRGSAPTASGADQCRPASVDSDTITSALVTVSYGCWCRPLFADGLCRMSVQTTARWSASVGSAAIAPWPPSRNWLSCRVRSPSQLFG